MKTIKELLTWGQGKLNKAGVNTAWLDAELLLLHALNQGNSMKKKHAHPRASKGMGVSSSKNISNNIDDCAPTRQTRQKIINQTKKSVANIGDRRPSGQFSLPNSPHNTAWLYAHLDEKMGKSFEESFKKLIKLRTNLEPIAYITSKKEFYGRDFYVDRRVLIPRPETELLVDEAQKAAMSFFTTTLKPIPSKYFLTPLPSKKTSKHFFAPVRLSWVVGGAVKKRQLLIVDVGTGSGAIIVSLVKSLQGSKTSTLPHQNFWRGGKKHLFDHCRFIATDISAKALQAARLNAQKHNVTDHIEFIQGDLLEPVMNHELGIRYKELEGNFRRLNVKNYKLQITSYGLLILANLPYLTPGEYRQNTNGLKYEPQTALVSPHNGLAHYERLFKQIDKMSHVCYPITIFLEHAPDQTNLIRELVAKYLPGSKVKTRQDLANMDRITIIKDN